MIEKSRIFVGTVEHLVTKSQDVNDLTTKSYLVDEIYKEEDVVLIAFDTNLGMRYVPLYCANNMFKFISISLASKQSVPNDRFLQLLADDNVLDGKYSERAWVSNCERLFEENGKTNLKELVSIQNNLHGNDNKKPIIL